MASSKSAPRGIIVDEKNSSDIPPMSRLFIICSKSITESDLRDSFEKFGEIEEIWVVKDKTSGDPKGTNIKRKSNINFINMRI